MDEEFLELTRQNADDESKNSKSEKHRLLPSLPIAIADF